MPVIATDPFAPSYLASILSAAEDFEVVTPSDADELRKVSRQLIVKAGYAVAVVRRDGTTVTLPDLGVTMAWNIRAKQVKATGTTAAAVIVALY